MFLFLLLLFVFCLKDFLATSFGRKRSFTKDQKACSMPTAKVIKLLRCFPFPLPVSTEPGHAPGGLPNTCGQVRDSCSTQRQAAAWHPGSSWHLRFNEQEHQMSTHTLLVF